MTEIKPIRKPKLPIEEVLPRIVIDTREQTPLVFTLPSEVRGLESGDYSIAGCESVFAVERKTVSDLIGCCIGDNRDRFFRELSRLRGFEFTRLLIIGNPLEVEQRRYRSNIHPNSVFGTIATIEVRFHVSAVWTPTPESAAQLVQRWSWYYLRERVKNLQAIADAQGSIVAPQNDSSGQIPREA